MYNLIFNPLYVTLYHPVS